MKHPKSYDSTPETRKRMSKVKLKGGKAETLLAKELWYKGYRYRKNDKRLPGSPDIAILKHRIAIFVDGEFWHGKDWGTRKGRLQRNREYWIEKIEEKSTPELPKKEMKQRKIRKKNVVKSFLKKIISLFKYVAQKNKPTYLRV